MRIDAYIRVSRVAGRSGDSFISPELQRRAIETWAEAHDHEIVAWHEELDQSAGKLDRPKLREALARANNHETQGIVAARLDRLTRSVADLGRLLEFAKKAGWNLVALDLGLDLHSPSGKLVANVLGTVAEWELDQRRESWRLSTANAIGRGVYIAGAAPTGYRKRSDKGLEPDPVAAPIVKAVFRRRAAGESWAELARFMTDAGIATPFGNPTWTGNSVKRLVGNVAYLGHARQGKRVNRNAHVPLVSRAEWEAAQHRRSRPRTAAANGEGLLLVGLARCASCRYRMKGHKSNGSYQCAGHHASGDCPRPTSIRAANLDAFVERLVRLQLGKLPLAEAVDASSELEAAAAAVEDAEYELTSYLKLRDLVRTVGEAAYEEGFLERQLTLEGARSALASVREKASGVLAFRLDLWEVWPELTIVERRQILSGAIDAVVIWPASGRGRRDPLEKRVRIVWRGEAPDDLPSSGRVVRSLAPWPGLRPGDEAKPHVRESDA